MSERIYYTVYRVTNKVNGKYYIGKHTTRDPYDDYMGTGTVITRAIQAYGIDAFEKQVLYFCESEEHAFEVESQLVTEDLINDPQCYNMRIGGKGGWKHSAESKETMREKALLRPPKSAETRKKISSVHTGRKRSAETINKLSAANIGKKHSAEARAKMSKQKLGRKIAPEIITKRVASRAGYRHSPETIEKMKLARKHKREANEKTLA